jgi:very-short-patch-repair endonuclease
MRDKPANGDRLIAAIAARQHGVVTIAQLRAAGVDDDAARRRVRAGRLHRIHRGVYAVGHHRLSFEGRCLAALLACGKAAVLSHRSAAAIWGMLRPASGSVELTVPTGAGRSKRTGIMIHRSATLTSTVVSMRSGIPVTTPGRTLRDVRRTIGRPAYQRAARRALDLRLITPEALGSEPDLTRSELERLFLRLCSRHRLPQPEVNAQVGSIDQMGPLEVDFLWRDHALVVETDGFRFHSGRVAFESDRARDARLQAAGYRVLRFSHRQVRGSPRLVVSALRRVMS